MNSFFFLPIKEVYEFHNQKKWGLSKLPSRELLYLTLYTGHPNGARASAALYSLIETAKANSLEPYIYFRYLFDKLPLAKSEDDYKALL